MTYTLDQLRAIRDSMTPEERRFGAVARAYLKELEAGPPTEAAAGPGSDTDEDLADKVKGVL